jgi:hypothetical protein
MPHAPSLQANLMLKNPDLFMQRSAHFANDAFVLRCDTAISYASPDQSVSVSVGQAAMFMFDSQFTLRDRLLRLGMLDLTRGSFQLTH